MLWGGEHVDPWGSLGSQLKLCDEIQAKLESLSQKTKKKREKKKGGEG